MKLYLVRHGETHNNLDRTVVGPDNILTARGEKDAEILAKRFSVIPIEAVITSSQVRAKQTAEIIVRYIEKPLLTNELLKERKWPREIEGKLLEDSAVKSLLQVIRDHANDPNWHYKDEESFSDVKKRAMEFLEYLRILSEENILIVSHEYLIKMLLAVMLYGDQLSYEIFRNFFNYTTLGNTSITLCERNNKLWRLITLNDQADL